MVAELEEGSDAMWRCWEGRYPRDVCDGQTTLGPIREQAVDEGALGGATISTSHHRFDWDAPTTVSLSPDAGQGATGGDGHQQTKEDTAVARVDAKVSCC